MPSKYIAYINNRSFRVPSNKAFIKGLITFNKIFNVFQFNQRMNDIDRKFDHLPHILLNLVDHYSQVIVNDIIVGHPFINEFIDPISYHIDSKYRFVSVINSNIVSHENQLARFGQLVIGSKCLSFVNGFMSGFTQLDGIQSRSYIPKILMGSSMYDVGYIHYLYRVPIVLDTNICQHNVKCYSYYPYYNDSDTKYCTSNNIKVNTKVILYDSVKKYTQDIIEFIEALRILRSTSNTKIHRDLKSANLML